MKDNKEIKIEYIQPEEVDQEAVNEIFNILFEEVIALDKLGKCEQDSLK